MPCAYSPLDFMRGTEKYFRECCKMVDECIVKELHVKVWLTIYNSDLYTVLVYMIDVFN